jgi:hypothetical protein
VVVLLRSAGKPWLLAVGGVAVGVAALAAASCGGGGSDQDSRYWQQLTSLMKPVVEDPSMTDHRAFMLPGGTVMALHFDNMDLDEAKNLNWVALGIPGRFCKDDQQRVERQFGKGFTHFHDLKNKSHGGKPGAEGVWFVHIGVRDFEAPWGQVGRGIDQNFMPTKAPDC